MLMTDHIHFPRYWRNDKYPDEVHAYTAKVAPNAVDKVESTLTQA